MIKRGDLNRVADVEVKKKTSRKTKKKFTSSIGPSSENLNIASLELILEGESSSSGYCPKLTNFQAHYIDTYTGANKQGESRKSKIAKFPIYTEIRENIVNAFIKKLQALINKKYKNEAGERKTITLKGGARIEVPHNITTPIKLTEAEKKTLNKFFDIDNLNYLPSNTKKDTLKKIST